MTTAAPPREGSLSDLYARLLEAHAAEQVAEAAEPHTGAMVALVPSDDDAARLAEFSDEDTDQLHCTLLYLGEAADLYPADREAIVAAVRDAFAGTGPVVAEGFSVNAFNPPGTARADGKQRDTCIVLGLSGADLAAAHRTAAWAVDDVGVDLPEQHEPWIPHVTLAYTDDLDQVAARAGAAGEVTFDRVRVAFAGANTDIPLTGPEPASEAIVITVHGDGAVAVLQVARALEGFDKDQLRGKDIGVRGIGAGRWVKGLIHGLGGPAPEERRVDTRWNTHVSSLGGRGKVATALTPRRPRMDDRVIDTDAVGERPRIGHVQAVRGDELRVRWDDNGDVETRPVHSVRVAGVRPEDQPAHTFVATPQAKQRMEPGPARPLTPARAATDAVAAGRMNPDTATRLLRGESPVSIVDSRTPQAFRDRELAKLTDAERAEVAALDPDRQDLYWMRRAALQDHGASVGDLTPSPSVGEPAQPKRSAVDRVFTDDAFKRYTAGDSIKTIAQGSGGMYSEAKVRQLLRERGVDFGRPIKASPPAKTAGQRLTGDERVKLTKALVRRYVAGESIQDLATSEGRSYAFVHRILTEAGIQLRARGGQTSGQKARAEARKASAAADRVAKAAAAVPDAGELLDRLQQMQSREQAAQAIADLRKSPLLAMARRLNVPRSSELRVDELRREIVDATVGRRLDSIATRGFTGDRP